MKMIHYDIPKPVLSPQFTLDDIHKIRAWNYERLKDATVDERLDDIHRRAAIAWARFEEYRTQNQTPEAPPTKAGSSVV
jgi:hypothetical protein